VMNISRFALCLSLIQNSAPYALSAQKDDS